MSQHIIFKPENYQEKNEPDPDTLWKVKYTLQAEDIDLPVYILNISEDIIDVDAYPLSYLENNFKLLNMKKIFDFPFSKEYVFEDDFSMSFTATLTALDIGACVNEIKIPKKFCSKFLKDLKLPESGKLHPARFHNLLLAYLDMSDSKYNKYDKYINHLTDLEDLCFNCIEYEKNIEWN